MSNTGPLGHYSEIVAAIVAIGVVVVYLLTVLFPTQFGASGNNALDAAFWAVLGYIFGTSRFTNGATKIATAAHVRLDEMEAKVK